MRQRDLFRNEGRLFEELCTIERLRAGFRRVKKNKGSPGVDGVTIEDFGSRLSEELSQLKEDLESWTYQPSPVRRVEIPKPGGKGIRLLGVPTVRDRVVHATLKELLEPIFEPLFSDHSYGFRPERNQRQAVESAREIVAGGKPYVVDIDLSKFFDRIHHDRLIARLSQQVADKRILRLIGLLLRSGIMANGLVTPSTEGAVQGSPLSPLLSNIVLDELDKELERRGLAFCRFADDCNIFVRTPKAAQRVMESISGYIEKRLKLVVNQEKSQVARSDRVKFLGMTIVGKTIAISHKALQTAMAKVKELTPRGSHLTLEKTLEEINSWYIGWAGYFEMTYYPAQLKKIEAHIRRRL
ncbi:MAG: group II intron reverse transcriptase/maturase, partial [Gammaproteobacteria bacterium]|nr:group II intron reverse transcriptase/maturase [Gammaproteobacteria bacterium]